MLMFKLGQNEKKGVDWAKRKMGIIQSLSLPTIFGTEMVKNKSYQSVFDYYIIFVSVRRVLRVKYTTRMGWGKKTTGTMVQILRFRGRR